MHDTFEQCFHDLFLFCFVDIFSLFSNESGSYVVREDMESMLSVVDGEVPIALKNCFAEVCINFTFIFSNTV